MVGPGNRGLREGSPLLSPIRPIIRQQSFPWCVPVHPLNAGDLMTLGWFLHLAKDRACLPGELQVSVRVAGSWAVVASLAPASLQEGIIWVDFVLTPSGGAGSERHPIRRLGLWQSGLSLVMRPTGSGLQSESSLVNDVEHPYLCSTVRFESTSIRAAKWRGDGHCPWRE